mmetsp:Transcript_94094/g.271976  ORF Transcript_94094/g.271976 Transcript_94094/m.271976 type:complete len:100 (+) Transcript_94094:259-558(+)
MQGVSIMKPRIVSLHLTAFIHIVIDNLDCGCMFPRQSLVKLNHLVFVRQDSKYDGNRPFHKLCKRQYKILHRFWIFCAIHIRRYRISGYTKNQPPSFFR